MDVLIIGIILLLVGLYTRYTINKRRFNRRSITGLQTFQSYEQAVGLTVVEKLLKIAGLILVLFGALLIIAYWSNHHSAKQAREQKTHQSEKAK